MKPIRLQAWLLTCKHCGRRFVSNDEARAQFQVQRHIDVEHAGQTWAWSTRAGTFRAGEES